MRVESPHGISAFRRTDTRELASPLCPPEHEDTMKIWTSANQEAETQQTLDFSGTLILDFPVSKPRNTCLLLEPASLWYSAPAG